MRKRAQETKWRERIEYFFLHPILGSHPASFVLFSTFLSFHPSFHSLIFFFLLSSYFSFFSQLFFLSSFEKIFNRRLSEFEKKKNLRIVCFLPLSLVSLLLITSVLFSLFSSRSSPLSHLLYVLNFSLSFIPVICLCVSEPGGKE